MRTWLTLWLVTTVGLLAPPVAARNRYNGRAVFRGVALYRTCNSPDRFKAIFYIANTRGLAPISARAGVYRFRGTATASGFSMDATTYPEGCIALAELDVDNRPGRALPATLTIGVSCGVGVPCITLYSGSLRY